jgi:hypothetical protein
MAHLRASPAARRYEVESRRTRSDHVAREGISFRRSWNKFKFCLSNLNFGSNYLLDTGSKTNDSRVREQLTNSYCTDRVLKAAGFDIYDIVIATRHLIRLLSSLTMCLPWMRDEGIPNPLAAASRIAS